jgi:hypothetical protein
MKKLMTISAAAFLLSIARAADPPPLKEGLWDVSGESIVNPGGKKTEFNYQLCRNHAYDKAMDALVKNAPGCTTSFDDLGGGRFASASSCSAEGTLIVSKGTYATYTPAYRGKTDERVLQDQRYVGDCPAGMKPGDRIAGGALQRYAR